MNLNSNGCILKIAVLVIRNLLPEYKKQPGKKLTKRNISSGKQVEFFKLSY